MTGRGWPEAPGPLAGLGNSLHDLHRWTIGTPVPTIYGFADALFLETGVPALTWVHNGIAAVAGGGEGDINLDERIDHELGHLLGLDHQDETFMRATLDLGDRLTTPFQRTKALLNAYEMGGF